VIFLDTSAIFALADADDPNHSQALELFRLARESGEGVLTHNYVLAEATALLQHRLGLLQAVRFLKEAESFQVHWVGPEDHQNAVALLEERNRRGLSLVDCMSFLVMRRYGVGQVLAFDPDFTREGFTMYSGADGS
jgi:predicted nucleic acid-binding protein